MCTHESQYCPRCNALFECKPGNISQCQCFGVRLPEKEKLMIEKEFSSCLCVNCLIDIKNGSSVQRKELHLQKNN